MQSSFSSEPETFWVLSIVVLSSFLTPFTGSSLNVALPTIARELGMDAVTMSWVATSFVLSASVFLVPFGRLADLHGRKRVFLWGAAIFTLSCLLLSITSSSRELIIFRVLQGLGSSMIFGTGIAILTSVVPPAERGKALGKTVASVYLGLTLGPFLGGIITEYLGWRILFLLNVPLGMLTMILVILKLKGEWAEARGESFDVVGTALYSVGLVLVVIGFSRIAEQDGPWLCGAGALGLALFVAWEAKTESPVLHVRLFFRNRVFSLSNLAAFINYSATYAVAFLISIHLQYALAMSPREAGMILITQPVIMTLVTPYAGKLSDRIQPGYVASAGMALTTAGLVLFTFLTGETGLPFIMTGLTCMGLGFAFFSSPNVNAIMGSVDRRYYGVASGTVGTTRLLGQMFSMALSTVIFSAILGRQQINADTFHLFLLSEQRAFAIFAVLSLIGTVASLARGTSR